MKYIKLFSVFLFIFSLVSCTITEKMIINDKGSGKFTYEIDGTKMMAMAG